MIPHIWKVRIKLTKNHSDKLLKLWICKKNPRIRANISTEMLVKPLWTTNKARRKIERGFQYRNCELGFDMKN
jgi:hypothetical protein